jgi:hypothetical protein
MDVISIPRFVSRSTAASNGSTATDMWWELAWSSMSASCISPT